MPTIRVTLPDGVSGKSEYSLVFGGDVTSSEDNDYNDSIIGPEVNGSIESGYDQFTGPWPVEVKNKNLKIFGQAPPIQIEVNGSTRIVGAGEKITLEQAGSEEPALQLQAECATATVPSENGGNEDDSRSGDENKNNNQNGPSLNASKTQLALGALGVGAFVISKRGNNASRNR